MSRPSAGRAPFWGGVAIAVVALGLIVFGRGPVDELLPLVAAIGYIVTGRLLTARRPDNAVSWVIATIGVILAITSATDSLLKGARPGDPELLLQLAALLNAFIWNLWLWALVVIALPLLFPDGRLPSRRWRWIVWSGVAGTLIGTLSTLFEPGNIDTDAARGIVNPFGSAGVHDAIAAVDGVASVFQAAAIIGAVAAIVVRMRRSRGVERQQLKWFAYVAGVAAASLVVAVVISSAGGEADWVYIVAPIGWFTALAMIGFGIPAATGVAVLRYRLYEIDVVIRRTLVYAGLTATLAGAYLGAVLLLQLALGPITTGSGLAVAVSTLAVAALFRPAQARIQAGVDHRFYRRRYDAARTLEGFSARLREQVDLDALGGELREVVLETMQPAHVSLWLRKPEEPAR
jgi:hypothetical protein